MNVKLIRLQTGEDLIANVTEDADKSVITLENPCMIYVRPNGASASVGITKWMPYAKAKNIELDKRWIVVLTEPDDDLANEYNKAFGSGIVVAPAGLKVN